MKKSWIGLHIVCAIAGFAGLAFLASEQSSTKKEIKELYRLLGDFVIMPASQPDGPDNYTRGYDDGFRSARSGTTYRIVLSDGKYFLVDELDNRIPYEKDNQAQNRWIPSGPAKRSTE